MLVPAEYRDAQRISGFPVKSLIFDDAVTLTGDYIVRLFVDVAMSARTFSGRELRHERCDSTHMEPALRVDYDSDISHPSWFEDEVFIANQNFACSSFNFFSRCEIQCLEIKLIGFASSLI